MPSLLEQLAQIREHAERPLVYPLNRDEALWLCDQLERRLGRKRVLQRVRVFFAWYDLWIGAYYDRRKRVLYICPLPCVCIAIQTSQTNA